MTMPIKLIGNRVEFCVVGHSRSGTGYMSALFGSLGYRIGHEIVQHHGISSWMWAVNTPIVPFGHPRNNMEIRHLLQVVRDPWNVVSSLITSERMDWRVTDFMKQYVYIDTTADQSAQAAYMVIGWNRLIQAQTPVLTVQVEKAVSLLSPWMTKHGYTLARKYRTPPTDHNTTAKSRRLDLELMTGWSKGLLLAFREHYQQYGYRVPELLHQLAG